MPSEFDSMFADDARPQLLAVFGEPVVRWPMGVEHDAEPVTAIVDRDKLDQAGEVGSGRRRFSGENERIPIVAELQLSSEQATDLADRWVIDGFVWKSVRQLSAEDGGMQTWLIDRLDKQRTAKGGRR